MEFVRTRVDGEYDSVGNPNFWDYVKTHENASLAFVHNHTTDGCFSERDMDTLLRHKNIKMFIATREDGIRYAVEKVKSITSNLNLDILYSKDINELRKKLRNDKINVSDYTKMREETIVNNLIRDYTKGLIELE